MAAGGASGIMRFLLPSQALPPEPPPDPTIMPTEPVMIEYLRSIKAKIDGSIKFSKNKTFVGKIEGVFPYDDITISPPDPIVLIGKSRQQVDRTTFYYKTVHVWCPEYFSKSDFTHEGKTLVKCPSCIAAGRSGTDVSPKGWGDVVKMCGVADTEYILPRRSVQYVLHPWSLYLYAGYESSTLMADAYVRTHNPRWLCNHCKKSYHCHLPEVLATMPRHIQLIAPFYLVGQTYISRSLVVCLHDHIAGGGSFASFHRDITSAHKTKYTTGHLAYVSMWDAANSSSADQTCPPAPAYGTYDDINGYDGDCVPSSQTFQKVWLDDHSMRAEWLDRRMMMVEPGQVMKGDASFKASKLIRTGGVKACESIFTLMNGRNEVSG